MKKQPTTIVKEEVTKKQETKVDNKKTGVSKDVKGQQSNKEEKKTVSKQEIDIKEDKKNPTKPLKVEVLTKQASQKRKEDKVKNTKQQLKDQKEKISKSIQQPPKQLNKQRTSPAKKEDLFKKRNNKSLISENKDKPILNKKQQPQYQDNTFMTGSIVSNLGINTVDLKSVEKQKGDVIQSSGLLRAYETFLKSLCKHGLPTGDVFEFAAQHVQKFQKRRIAKQLKLKAEADIRKKARFHNRQQYIEQQEQNKQ